MTEEKSGNNQENHSIAIWPMTNGQLATMKLAEIKLWMNNVLLLDLDRIEIAEILSNDTRTSVKSLGEKIYKEIEYQKKEKARLSALFSYERDLWSSGYTMIAGVDEAGRGPLVGSVVTAAVVFSNEVHIEGLDDSKKLSEAKRDALYDEIMEKALAVSVGIADQDVIDDINILNATKKAMTEAIEKLSVKADYLLLDAVKLNNLATDQLSLIKGDQKSASIAAASIIAKVTRDRMMVELDQLYPQYGFLKHKGYGTADHVQALKTYGPCPFHRRSFIKNFFESEV